MEEKQVVEQEVRELTEPEMEKVVGGVERARIKDTDFAAETANFVN